MSADQVTVRIDPDRLLALIRQKLDAVETQVAFRVIGETVGRKVVAGSKEIAETELHRRPTERRTKESIEHGKEYHDSFFHQVDMSQFPRAVRVGVGNNHPAAPIIRKGSQPHQIETQDSSAKGYMLRFPAGKGSRVAPGSRGGWAVNGPPWVDTMQIVDHPGQENPLNIVRRAAQKYLEGKKK